MQNDDAINQAQAAWRWRTIWLDSHGNIDEQVIAFSLFCAALWGLTIWNLLHGQPVAISDFATAQATIAGACGLATGFNRWAGG